MTMASPAVGLLIRRTLDFTQVDGIVGLVAKTAAGQLQRDSGLAVYAFARAATSAAGRRRRTAADGTACQLGT